MSINVAIISGRIGQRGDLGKSGTGEDVTNFTVMAEAERKQRGSGTPRKAKEWHRITAYGELAKVAAELPPQTVVIVHGRMQHNRRMQAGVPQHSVDIIAKEIDVVWAPQVA